MKPMKSIGRFIFVGFIFAVTVVTFQNCSEDRTFDTSGYNSSASSSGDSGSAVNPIGVKPRILYLTDTSYGNGTGLVRIRQSVQGAGGAGLKGCTVPLSLISQYCLNDSDYRIVVSGDGWVYDQATDTYSVDFDATGWPQTSYVTKYILPDGSRGQVNFTPMTFIDGSYGNGSTLVKIKQSIKGAGVNLKGCTVPTSMASQYCVTDAEYRFVTSGDSWNYDTASDTYSTEFDAGVSWPQTTYITRYISSDGRRFDVKFTPK